MKLMIWSRGDSAKILLANLAAISRLKLLKWREEMAREAKRSLEKTEEKKDKGKKESPESNNHSNNKKKKDKL